MLKRILNFLLFFFYAAAVINYFSPTAFAQQEGAYQYKRKVFLVELQVSVFDKDGKFVEGLKPEDFVIIDEGMQQKISHFDYVVHDEQNVDLISQNKAGYKRRLFFLLFDLSFVSRRGLKNERKFGLEFIDMLLPTDLVALATFSSYHGLNVLVNFTNDKEVLKEAIGSLGLKKATQIVHIDDKGDEDPISTKMEEFSKELQMSRPAPVGPKIDSGLEKMIDYFKSKNTWDYESHVENFISQLTSLGVALSSIKGKKNIIYFSEGFGFSIFNLEKTEKMLERFIGSGCVIQSIDVGGLRSSFDFLEFIPRYTGFSWHRPGHQALFYLAHETGGVFYYNTNLLDRALKKILDLSSRYYAIGYYPKEIGNEGKYRKIKVKLKRPGVKVITRKGYFEDKPFEEYTPLEKKVRVAKLINEDIAHNDIQYDAFISVFPGNAEIARVPIFLQIPKHSFLDEKEKEQTKLEMFGFLINDKGYFKDFIYTGITVDARESKDWLENSRGIKHYDMLLAPQGKHKVKLIVQDSDTGEVGSKIYSIKVPDYQRHELAMTPPIFIDNDVGWLLSRGYDPNNPEGKKEGLPVSYPFAINNQEFIPAVMPEIKVGQPAQFCLKVYNLRLHPEAKVPQTKMDFEIVYPDGSSSKIQKISLMNKPTLGKDDCFELLFQFVLEKMPPGEYKLKATVIDNLANKKVESSAPFIITP